MTAYLLNWEPDMWINMLLVVMTPCLSTSGWKSSGEGGT